MADDFNTAQATTKVRNLITLTEKIIKGEIGGDGVSTMIGNDAIASVSNFVTGYFHSLGFGQMVEIYIFLPFILNYNTFIHRIRTFPLKKKIL